MKNAIGIAFRYGFPPLCICGTAFGLRHFVPDDFNQALLFQAAGALIGVVIANEVFRDIRKSRRKAAVAVASDRDD